MAPADLRNVYPRVVLKIGCKGLRVFPFEQIIDFFIQDAGEFIQQSGDVGAPPNGAVAVEPDPYGAQRSQVSFNYLLDIRAQDLDDHILTARPVLDPLLLGAAQFGDVHLPKRCGGERLLVKTHENVRNGFLEFRFDNLADFRVLLRGNLILQSC